MTDIWHEESRVACPDKQSCEQCGSAIETGTQCHHAKGFYEGPYEHYVHDECEAAAKEYATEFSLWGEDWPWFQHQDDEPDDWRWMLEKHPIVAKRLGWDERLADWLKDD